MVEWQRAQVMPRPDQRILSVNRLYCCLESHDRVQLEESHGGRRTLEIDLTALDRLRDIGRDRVGVHLQSDGERHFRADRLLNDFVHPRCIGPELLIPEGFVPEDPWPSASICGERSSGAGPAPVGGCPGCSCALLGVHPATAPRIPNAAEARRACEARWSFKQAGNTSGIVMASPPVWRYHGACGISQITHRERSPPRKYGSSRRKARLGSRICPIVTCQPLGPELRNTLEDTCPAASPRAQQGECWNCFAEGQ